jgi:hypothetical protein
VQTLSPFFCFPPFPFSLFPLLSKTARLSWTGVEMPPRSSYGVSASQQDIKTTYCKSKEARSVHRKRNTGVRPGAFRSWKRIKTLALDLNRELPPPLSESGPPMCFVPAFRCIVWSFLPCCRHICCRKSDLGSGVSVPASPDQLLPSLSPLPLPYFLDREGTPVSSTLCAFASLASLALLECLPLPGSPLNTP